MIRSIPSTTGRYMYMCMYHEYVYVHAHVLKYYDPLHTFHDWQVHVLGTCICVCTCTCARYMYMCMYMCSVHVLEKARLCQPTSLTNLTDEPHRRTSLTNLTDEHHRRTSPTSLTDEPH